MRSGMATFFFLLFCRTISANADVPGQESSSHPNEAYALPEIVVTAKHLRTNPGIERRLGIENLRAWNAHTAAEALVQMPGVNVQYGGSSGDAKIWMRGFRDRDILILFDGIPIASAFEGNIDLNEISTEAVTEIRVSKSAPSVIYGPNGMGGVVDIVPQADIWPRAFTSSVESGADDYWRIRAAYTGVTKQSTYRISGSFTERDTFALSDDFRQDTNQNSHHRANADNQRENIFGYLQTDTDTLGQTSFFYTLSKNERGLAPEVGVDDADFERLTKSNRHTLGISNQFERIPLSLKLFRNEYNSELEIYTDNTYSDLDEVEDAEEETYGAMAYYSMTAGDRHVFVFGLTGIKDHFESEGALEGYDDASLKTYSLAAEDHFTVGTVSVVMGAMFSRFEQPEENRSLTTLNPQITMDWLVSDNVTIHSSAAQRTRFPKLRELYQRRRGNPELEEQIAYNYQLGLLYRHPSNWSAEFTAFRSDLDDLIERPDRRSSYENLPNVTFEGFEATASWKNARIFSRFSYTYLDAVEELPSGRERQIRSRAKHSIHSELRVTLNHGFSLAVNGIYSDGLYDLDGEENHLALPDYLALHLKASKSFSEHTKGYISISNVTDDNYMHRLGFPRPGRELRVGLEIEI